MIHHISLSWSSSSEQAADLVDISGNHEENFGDFTNSGITVASGGGTTSVQNLNIPVASLLSFIIASDQTLTLETNAPTNNDTLTITGGVPFIWYSTSGVPNPFTSGVTATSMKFTNNTATLAKVAARFLW